MVQESSEVAIYRLNKDVNQKNLAKLLPADPQQVSTVVITAIGIIQRTRAQGS